MANLFAVTTSQNESERLKRAFGLNDDDIMLLEREQLEDAKERIPIINFVNIMVGLLTLATLAWADTPVPLLYTWAGALAYSVWLRHRIYTSQNIASSDVAQICRKCFLIASFFSGLVWGFAGLYMEIYMHEEHHAFGVFVLAGLAAGAVATNSAIRWNYPLFAVPMLAFPGGYYFFEGNVPHIVMGVMVLLYIIVMSFVARMYRGAFNEQRIMRHISTGLMQRLTDITSSIAEGVFVLDKYGRLDFINPEAERLLGWHREELENKDLHSLVHYHAEETADTCVVRKAYLYSVLSRSKEDHFRRKNGEVFPVLLTAAPVQTSHGIEGAVVVFSDISERKKMEAELERLARHDALTGLHNRGSFDKRLREELARSQRYATPLALLMVDIDHFKRINDTYGHQAGDRVLQGVAHIIRQTTRESDFAARYGGEEFTVLLPQSNAQKAYRFAHRLHRKIGESRYRVNDDTQITLSVSIGITTVTESSTPDSLIKESDDALYRAKSLGRDQVVMN